MALVATLAGWATLWFVTVRMTPVVELQFDDDEAEKVLAYAGQTEGNAKLVTLANVLLNLDETLTKP